MASWWPDASFSQIQQLCPVSHVKEEKHKSCQVTVASKLDNGRIFHLFMLLSIHCCPSKLGGLQSVVEVPLAF